jgi:ABC-2 type transport system permease protein
MTEYVVNQGEFIRGTAVRETAPARLKFGLLHELNAVLTILARGILLTLKSPATLIMSLAMPVMMMGMIGGNLSQNMAGGLAFDYGPFMLVGMIVCMLFMMTSEGLTTLVDDRETNFTQEMMVSPVSRYSIIVGTILGSSFMAVVSSLGAVVVGLVMGIRLGAGQLLAILTLSPLVCLAAGAFTMLLLGAIKNRKAANLSVTFATMPQMFLSGAIIPVANSSGVLLVLNRLMPMTYCLDLVRAAVYAGTPEYAEVVMFNPAVTLAAIVALTVVFLAIGTFMFARGEKNR